MSLHLQSDSRWRASRFIAVARLHKLHTRLLSSPTGQVSNINTKQNKKKTWSSEKENYSPWKLTSPLTNDAWTIIFLLKRSLFMLIFILGYPTTPALTIHDCPVLRTRFQISLGFTERKGIRNWHLEHWLNQCSIAATTITKKMLPWRLRV